VVESRNHREMILIEWRAGKANSKKLKAMRCGRRGRKSSHVPGISQDLTGEPYTLLDGLPEVQTWLASYRGIRILARHGG
jgi:hypothetical protein